MTETLNSYKPEGGLGLNSETRKELGPRNLENLSNFSEVLRTELQEKKIEAHLILVGGNVMPEKRGKYHKDVDLIFYSREVGIGEVYPKEDSPTFAKFAEFLKNVGDNLSWEEKVNKPYFFDYEYSFDGSVELIPKEGVPLELLPVRADSLRGSFEDYVKNQDRPMAVIF